MPRSDIASQARREQLTGFRCPIPRAVFLRGNVKAQFSLRPFIFAAGLFAAGALLLKPFQPPQTSNARFPTATWSLGVLHVSIPYHAPHAGEGELTVEVVDPEGHILGQSARHVAIQETNGSWREDLRLTNPPDFDELVWHRVRYRFVFDDSSKATITGVESISRILRAPVIHIRGQRSYLAGSPASVRVIVTDRDNRPLTGRVIVRGKAPNQSDSYALFTGVLNSRGTTEAQLRFPKNLAGSYSLQYTADTPIGSVEYVQTVRLEEKLSILLTTEKPIYQPGQTIHIRALALDRANHEAVNARSLSFEIQDSRGNRVFRKAATTDQFGIAFTTFSLADEVNLGAYHLRAAMGDNSADLTLNVERYVLPKFKVAVDFGEKSGTAKHGYRAGDHVTGTVRANYFFGQPVSSGEVTINASAMDVAPFNAATIQGKTNADGVYHFDLPLPSYFAGRPLSQGAARVLIEATVKDSADHSETRGEPITVSDAPLLVTAVPEGGTLAPNLENQIFILTSYPDGKPAVTDLRLRDPDLTARTDEGGVAVVSLKPGANVNAVQIEARDKEGNHVSTSVPLQSRTGSEQIILRTERAVYRAGDRIRLRVLSTKAKGAAYIDVTKDGQTVLTRDVDLRNGQAELSMVATPELAGTIDCNAYIFGADAQPVSDHRLIFVQPANDLKIEATADAAVYKPGDDARVRFRITNSRGEGVSAALGVQVVDEAVFALAEKQPGFAKVFFYLEQEAMKPRYEIHSIGLPEIVEPVAPARAAQRDRAARALFAATETIRPASFQGEFGRTPPTVKYTEYAARYRAALVARLRQTHWSPTRVQWQAAEVRDAWDGKLRVENPNWSPGGFWVVRSAGPDKRFSTADDLVVSLAVRSKRVLQREPANLQVRVEHNRGPVSTFGQITGTVLDSSGEPVPDVRIWIRNGQGRRERGDVTDAAGQFTLAAVPAGRYRLEMSTSDAPVVSRELTLSARDLVVLTATVGVERVDQAVVVGGGGFAFGSGSGGGGDRPPPPPARAFGVVGGVPGGIAGGRPAGTAGGVIGGVLSNVREQVALYASLGVLGDDTAPGLRTDATVTRVRSYFPEALYINPEIITDQHGIASISIPLADSITTWRMAMIASTPTGALGSANSSIKVFQDFFADLDLPVTLTQGDRVSIPVAVHNYSGTCGDVGLHLEESDWFALVNDTAKKSLTVEPGRVGGAHFTIEAKRIGKFKLTLTAAMNGSNGRRGDVVVREIEVVPNGREQNVVFNGRLETSIEQAVNFPAAAIPDAGRIFVRLYPGPLSQVIEGMDAILRMPFGCFEQTSSATYPNVLALDYMKRTRKVTPELHAKAEGFIANGYQRLLTFEVPSGGFSWFGQAPANKILTSYGLMEFSDMSKVHDVDPHLIERTQQWLSSQQQPDGSWKPDANFINEGATNRYNSDALRITAYIAWALENSGYRGPAIEKAREFIEQNADAKSDAYTLAVLANFATEYQNDRALTHRVIQQLLNARTEKGEQAWWTADETAVFGRGESASIETTGLAVQALLKSGQAPAVTRKALAYIASKKDASGAWGSTQATIMALRAVLLSTEKGSADVRGDIEISLNGKPVRQLTLTPDNNDLFHQFVLSGIDSNGENQVKLRFRGTGSLAFQIAGRYFLPWDNRPEHEPLSIEVKYDRTHLAQNDIATATAVVRNNLEKTANMVMVDLGIPPGFDLLSEDLQDLQQKSASRNSGRLEKFSMTATQAILYFNSIAAGEAVTVRYRLRAKYPIRARTFRSRVYEYYDPDVNSVARPVQLEVRR